MIVRIFLCLALLLGLCAPLAADAFVRSRTYQEVIDGEVQPADGLADLSRVQRQQTFLRAVLNH